MKKELQEQLINKYPLLFELVDVENERMNRTGIECDDGWYDLIDKLCEAIMMYCHKAEIIKPPVFHQIKEKFGTIRTYMFSDDKIVNELIDLAHYRSTHTCEKCGSEDAKLDNTNHWIRTVCEKHRGYWLKEK